MDIERKLREILFDFCSLDFICFSISSKSKKKICQLKNLLILMILLLYELHSYT